MTAPHGYAMGVDLGTSNTVAVVRWPDGRTRPLLVDGVPVLPSGVYLDEHGRLHVGRDAHRLAQVEPARYEPNPKRRIDEGAVLLGDREVPAVHLLAAVLGGVGRAALEAVGHLPPAALTYPASWGSRRRDMLVEAAALAGWPPVKLVPEPVGAARYFADVLRRPVPFGSSLAVFDFGGGTLDIAVVRNDGAQFSVLGSGGIEDLGGLDIDFALVEHLGRMISGTRPDVWSALANPTTTAQRRDRRLFWDDVRGAKEMLSRVAVAPVTVPGLDAAVHLTREELESVATPLLRRAVHETGAVIRACGLRPDALAGLFLVGGSSRLPLAARLLHHDLGIAPTVLEQPELPVAEGAIAELAASAASAAQAAPVSGPVAAPVSGPAMAPVSGPAAGPVSGGPGTTTYGPTGTGGYGPAGTGVYGPAGYGDQTGAGSGPIGPASPAPYLSSEPMSAPPGPMAAPPLPVVSPPAPRRLWQRAGVLASAVGVLLVLALVAAGGWWYFTRETPVDFVALKSTGPTVPYGDGSPDRVASYTLGDVTYLAWTRDKAVDVAAVNVATGKRLWQKQAPAGADVWEKMYAGPAGIVLFPGSISSSEPEPMFVLDPGNGSPKWQRDVTSNERVLFFEAAIVVQSEDGKSVSGLDWRTGNQKWGLGNRTDDENNALATRNVKVEAGDEASVASMSGDQVRVTPGDGARLLQFDKDQGMRVVEVASGKQRTVTGVEVDSETPILAAGDKAYLVVVSNGYQVREYDLTKPGKARVIFTEANSARKVTTPPVLCGENRLCFIEHNGSDAKSTQVVAVDTEAGKLAWRKAAPGVNRLEPMGTGVLATTDGSTPVSQLFDADGNQVIPDDAKATVGVRVNPSSSLLFSRQFSTYADDVALDGVTIDGKRTALGSINVSTSSCSWNATFLVCAAEKEWKVWRFAE
ncbi:hsp70 family protein [Virgisporangium aurantiacum]|uniref:hsp70 family protein n=1 Tax=Virgisporangium aurantiacum TaxID=175570 RepID=UPI00194E29B8|nr:hsp70 family protein [Virgisporangium aurantiacum]